MELRTAPQKRKQKTVLFTCFSHTNVVSIYLFPFLYGMQMHLFCVQVHQISMQMQLKNAFTNVGLCKCIAFAFHLDKKQMQLHTEPMQLHFTSIPKEYHLESPISFHHVFDEP